MRVRELPTPALVVDLAAFEHNAMTMGSAWPGTRLRPHVKAFKSTALAQKLTEAGHSSFCCATPREVLGMAAAGLGHDLLLANETIDLERLEVMARCDSRVTVAVDSEETIRAAASAGLTEALIDVNVGLPRCGCDVDDAGRLGDLARRAGLSVRGVMGYEGHVVGVEDRRQRESQTEKAMEVLLRAHDQVGGEIISGGGTGTWDINRWVNEMQAGSYTLMDTAYAKLSLPFMQAVAVVGSVISVNRSIGFAVADVGLKALGMDHGNPAMDAATVWFCSDEHITFGPAPDGSTWPPAVGDRVLVWPAHIDPTLAKHERMLVIEGPLTSGGLPHSNDGLPHPGDHGLLHLDAEIVDEWPIDLRHW